MHLDISSNGWLFYALAGLICFALINVIDGYFREEIFENVREMCVSSALFKFMGIFGILFLGFNLKRFVFIGSSGELIPKFFIGTDVFSLWSMLAGVFLMSALFCYFKYLFFKTDLSLLQTFWNGGSITVPILAFFFLGEKLGARELAGIAVIFGAATYVSISAASFRMSRAEMKKVLFLVLPLLIFYSLYEIVARWISEYKGQGELFVFVFVSLGQVIWGIGLLLFDRLGMRSIGLASLFGKIKKNFSTMIFSESLELLGNYLIIRAFFETPKVAYVAAVETFMPLLVVYICAMVVLVYEKLNFHSKISSIKRIKDEELSVGLRQKYLATFVMVIGVLLIEW